MKRLWQNARCCNKTYQRWTLEGRPFNGGMANCVHCNKPLHYVDSTGAKRRLDCDKADSSLPLCGGEKTKAIDLGLEICATHCQFGRPLTHRQIAAFCGCTPGFIFHVEKKALRKLRAALARLKQSYELGDAVRSLKHGKHILDQ